MALGPDLLKPGSVPILPVEEAFFTAIQLEDLRGGERAIFTGMHDILGYEGKEPRLLDGLFPRKSPGSPVESDKARYRAEDELPHNAVMTAWLHRERESRHVALVTQPLEYVGIWLPVGEPRIRSTTVEGGRVAIEGFAPEVFENLDPIFQAYAIVKTQQALGFLGLNYDVLDGAPEAPEA